MIRAEWPDWARLQLFIPCIDSVLAYFEPWNTRVTWNECCFFPCTAISIYRFPKSIPLAYRRIVATLNCEYQLDDLQDKCGHDLCLPVGIRVDISYEWKELPCLSSQSAVFTWLPSDVEPYKNPLHTWFPGKCPTSYQKETREEKVAWKKDISLFVLYSKYCYIIQI